MSMYCGWNDTERLGIDAVTLPRALRPILAPLASPSRSRSATHSGGYQWAWMSTTRTRGAACALTSPALITNAAAEPERNARRVNMGFLLWPRWPIGHFVFQL